jgi:hypothetical protein
MTLYRNMIESTESCYERFKMLGVSLDMLSARLSHLAVRHV